MIIEGTERQRDRCGTVSYSAVLCDTVYIGV
jgi:hypothetical protein